MAISAPIAAALIGAGATGYSVNRQRAAAEDAGNRANEVAAAQLAESQKIDLPESQSTANQVQQGEQQAASAGGTITNDPAKGFGDSSMGSLKQLLGA